MAFERRLSRRLRSCFTFCKRGDRLEINQALAPLTFQRTDSVLRSVP